MLYLIINDTGDYREQSTGGAKRGLADRIKETSYLIRGTSISTTRITSWRYLEPYL